MKWYFFSFLIFLCSCTDNSLKQKTNNINKGDSAQAKNIVFNQENSTLTQEMELIQGKWKYEDNSDVAMVFEGNKRYDYGYDSVVYTFEISYNSVPHSLYHF